MIQPIIPQSPRLCTKSSCAGSAFYQQSFSSRTYFYPSKYIRILYLGFIHHIHRRTVHERPHILSRRLHDPHTCLLRCPRNVRRDDAARRSEEWIVRANWLLRHYINRSTADFPAREGGGKICLHNERPAPVVDNDHAVLHLRNPRGIDQSLRLLCQRTVQAEAARRDADSVFHFYQTLIRLRKEMPLIQKGDLFFLERGNASVLAYERTLGSSKLRVYCNFRAENPPLMEDSLAGLAAAGWTKLLSNYDGLAGDLRPYEVVALQK